MPLTAAPNEIRIRATGEVLTEQAFRDMYPRTSFPRVLTTEIITDFGADPVLEAPAPAVTQYQSAYRDGVTQDALGNWVQAWAVRDWTQAEIDASVSSNRDASVIAIDADADSIRNAVLGGRTTEYQQAESDADAFKAAGYTGTVPDSVQSWLDAKNAVGANWTAQQACDDILTTAANWKGAQSQIRANRLLRKEQIKAATTQADIDTAMSAWRTFAAQMRTNLGI